MSPILPDSICAARGHLEPGFERLHTPFGFRQPLRYQMFRLVASKCFVLEEKWLPNVPSLPHEYLGRAICIIADRRADRIAGFDEAALFAGLESPRLAIRCRRPSAAGNRVNRNHVAGAARSLF